jgi:hypothetical protein
MKSREATAKRYAKALPPWRARAAPSRQWAVTSTRSWTRSPASPRSRACCCGRGSPAEREVVAREVAKAAGLGKLVQDFVSLVAARGRADHLREMAAAYRTLVDEASGRVTGEVRTAAPMTDDEKRRLSARLGQAIGKQVVLEEIVDRSLLGGFIARVGSFVLDGSLDGSSGTCTSAWQGDSS